MNYETDSVGADSMNEITSQGNITTHAFIPDLLKQRKDNVRNVRSDENIIGSSFVDPEHLAIMTKEIVVADKDNQILGQAKTAHNVSGFTSFVGIRFPKGQTQMQFNRRFTVLGFSTSKYDPSRVVNSSSGISLRKGGSGSTLNTSGTVLMPGDIFGARLPSINEAERAEQYATESSRRRPNALSVSHKFMATVTKLTYEEIIGSFDHVAEHLIQNNDTIHLPTLRGLSSSSQKRGSEFDQLASALKKYNGYGFLSGVQAVLESGLVVPTVPSLMTGREMLVQWETNRAPIISDDDPSLIYKHRWIPGPSNVADIGALVTQIRGAANEAAGIAVFQNASREWSGRFESIRDTDVVNMTQRKEAHQAIIEALGVKFGLAENPDEAVIDASGSNLNTEDIGLTLAANIRLLIGSVGTTLHAQRASLVDFVKKDFPDSAILRRDAFSTPIASGMTVGQQLYNGYNEAPTAFARLLGRLFDDSLRFAMGTVTNTSKPNGVMHYALG